MENQVKDNFRPPIVTIMGHVDHGKTTLLDTVRKTNVVAREHGGITQHIGAYQITFQNKLITFIDTPGHAAFEKMRSRGAEVADIVILVVAADDGVKPQTIEAIRHIKKAQKPLVVAITKTDLPNINIEKVKKELEVAGIVVESYGGDVPVVEVAAPKNKSINELLEVILLVWDFVPEASRPNEPLEAVVVESFLDKNRGPIVTAIVKKGTIKAGQKIIVDSQSITVRALIDENGKNVQEAPPSKPVEILGFKNLLEVGSIINDQTFTKPQIEKHPKAPAEIIAQSEEAKGKFKVIIKADVTGSLEAILSNLPEKTLVVLSGVGDVSEQDVSFAKITNAPILTFNAKVAGSIKSLAEREGVVIRTYNVIYEFLSDLQNVTLSFEEAKRQLKIAGRAKIIATFNIDGKKIAGAKITHGKFKIGDTIQLKHNQSTTQKEARIISLKRFKKNVEVVSSGQDCGIGTSPDLDVVVGDVIESLG